MPRKKSPGSLENRVLARMKRGKDRAVFASVQFLALGNRAAIDQALSRLCRVGKIERAGRGLYHLPGNHPTFGTLGPDPEEVVRAIARRDGLRVQEGGAYAANAMRLTEQVPARIIYDTDGPSRKVRLRGKLTIEFKHRSTRKMAGAGRVIGVLISALANIGEKHVTTRRLAHLRQDLKAVDKRQLLADLALAPTWMHPYLRYIATGPRAR